MLLFSGGYNQCQQVLLTIHLNAKPFNFTHHSGWLILRISSWNSLSFSAINTASWKPRITPNNGQVSRGRREGLYIHTYSHIFVTTGEEGGGLKM